MGLHWGAFKGMPPVAPSPPCFSCLLAFLQVRVHINDKIVILSHERILKTIGIGFHRLSPFKPFCFLFSAGSLHRLSLKASDNGAYDFVRLNVRSRIIPTFNNLESIFKVNLFFNNDLPANPHGYSLFTSSKILSQSFLILVSLSQNFLHRIEFKLILF
jgi:hypothetical protein